MDLAITVATERREVQSRRDKHGPRQASVSSYPERLGGPSGLTPIQTPSMLQKRRSTDPERFAHT